MSAELAIELLCMILPLKGQYLLVPSVNVAEIIPSLPSDKHADSDEWRLGFIQWRQISIPLIDFEGYSLGHSSYMTSKMIAVMNVVSANAPVDFYAIALQQTPNLVRVHPGQLVLIERPLGLAGHACVELGEEQVFIPDLNKLEQAFLNH